MNKPHILITGERGIGKSTLVNKLISNGDIPLYGYRTKNVLKESDGTRNVYIYEICDKSCRNTEENCVASSSAEPCRRGMTPRPEIFDSLGVQYLEQAKPDGMIVMDELGFLETDAHDFCKSVLTRLDGDIPVLAVVRLNKETEFLNKVRRHPKTELYTVTKENRDELFDVLKEHICSAKLT